MRLSDDKIKAGILHPEQRVRDAAVFCFARSFNPDPSIMFQAINAIETYGWEKAFAHYSFMNDLSQCAETLRWMLSQLQSLKADDGDWHWKPVGSLSLAIAHCHPILLQTHERELIAANVLDNKTLSVIRGRIALLSQTPEHLWQRLEEFCTTNVTPESASADDFDAACWVVEALGRFRSVFADRVLAILRRERGDHDNWMETMAIRLAGEMRLENTIPHLVSVLCDDRDWAHEECHRAMCRIGTDAVADQLAKVFPSANWKLRLSAACILEDIHRDRTIEVCARLLDDETNREIKCRLLQAMLMNFSIESIEPARQFVLEMPLTPEVLEVRSALLTACQIMSLTFPEFERWLEESQNDDEMRRNWYMHPVNFSSGLRDGSGVFDNTGEESAFNDVHHNQPMFNEFDEDSDSIPIRIVEMEPKPDEPCPCGSGTPYQECCEGTSRIFVANDDNNAAHMADRRNRRSRSSRYKYPIGTVAFYGPDDETTTKIVAGVVLAPGADVMIERWVGTDVDKNTKVLIAMDEFFGRYGIRSVAVSEGNLGCPHEEGDDYPVGEDCPFCPFWEGKQGKGSDNSYW